MPSHSHESAAPPAEATLIRRAREARGLSPEAAAQRLKIKLSGRRWRQLEEARDSGTGKPTEISDPTLAHMAHVVGVSPEQLDARGRAEAAEILREIERQATVSAPPGERPEIPEDIDLDAYEDWAREIWLNLSLTSPDDKIIMIESLRLHRRMARRPEGAQSEPGKRRSSA